MTRQYIDIAHFWDVGDLAKALRLAANSIEDIGGDEQVEGILTDYADDVGWTVKVVFRTKDV